MKLNPNHRVTKAAHDQWHKIVTLIMVHQGLTEITLTEADVLKIADGNINIVLDARDANKAGFLTVRIVDNKTAAELARHEGGRSQDS